MPIFNRITYSPVETDAYAVFDSSDGSFTFFRDIKGKYTDGQVSGTKTYYTGFEDITGETDPSWYNSGYHVQKNTIKTVAFKDKIKPKTCYDWFSGAVSLTSIIGLDKLDTENVTNMYGMFSGCTGLTSLDLSSFSNENVTNMGYMFYNCKNLTDLDLSSFNTAKVKDMSYMFQNCESLTSLDLSSFNTAAVTSMGYMFYNCKNLTDLDLSSFNTAKVTYTICMFQNCSKLKTIYASSLFTTDAVSSSNSMFGGCTSLVGGAGTKYDANHKDKTYARIDGGASRRGYFTAKVAYAVYDSTDQSMTFFRDTPGKYTDGQVSGTKTYYRGFEDITGTTKPSWLDSSSGDQKNKIKTVTFKDKIKPKTCHAWFSDAVSLTSITGLDKLDTANVTYMDWMFDSCSSLTSLNLSSFNTANVTYMNRMFQNCSKLTSLNLSSFNTENVMTMVYMFYNCSSLKTIYASSLFTTDAVSSSNSMFDGCTSLVGGAGTTYDLNHRDKTYARIDGGTSRPGYFTAKAAPAKASLQR